MDERMKYGDKRENHQNTLQHCCVLFLYFLSGPGRAKSGRAGRAKLRERRPDDTGCRSGSFGYDGSPDGRGRLSESPGADGFGCGGIPDRRRCCRRAVED